MDSAYVRSDIPFLSVTLVGAAKSGKTALANAFVNNIFDVSYNPTTERMFYHCYFKPPSGDGESEVSWCIEIEDMPAFDKTDDSMLEVFNSFPSGTGAMRKVHKMQTEKAQREKESKKGGAKKGDDKYPCLTSLVEAPVKHVKPLTCNRMVYFFVFDCNLEESYKDARGAYELMMQYREKKGATSASAPITIFVATKIDVNPWDKKFKQVKMSAMKWSQTDQIPLYFVSAREFVRIKSLFKKAIEKAKEKETLWNIRKPDMEAKSEHAGNQGCSLQ